MSENYKNISNSVWNIANLLRGSWKSYEYQDVILPFLVLRRLDTALAPTKQKVLSRFNDLEGRAKNPDILKRESSYDFYNTSPFDFKKLIDDPNGLEKICGITLTALAQTSKTFSTNLISRLS